MLRIGETDPTFLREVWGLYGVGVSILFLRFAVRLKTVGLRGMQGDDLFALLTLAMYTMDAATVHIIYYTATNVEATAYALTHDLSRSEIAQFEFGSKEQLTAWYSYTALIWCLKGTMLCFFKRMANGLKEAKVINYLCVACALCYIAVVCTVTFGCWPYHKNWQVVPDPGLKCTFKMQNFLVTVVLNVLTDASILCIPLPLLWKLQIPIRKKLVIGILLSSGLFVISAALIRTILTLASHPSALTINRWGVRETIVGIISVNVPILRPLFNRSFWRGNRLAPTSDPKSGTRTYGTGVHGPYEMTSSVNDSRFDTQCVDGKDNSSDSEELIQDQKVDSKAVVIKTVLTVSNEDVAGVAGGNWLSSGQGAYRAAAYRGDNAV
ncbi:hypothetical protein F4780DRAFT_793384 [Xylariomycetidae sp. FL0641]|nr:hypothetical protein F4780DRAFT_793384 [Xylariomycetidae sp. FL0641]